VLALVQRDRRALLALTTGTLASTPLFAAHLAAGCTLAQALLFSQGDYLRTADRIGSLADWDSLVALANPIALGAALVGAPLLWREQRAVALTGGVIIALYLNELWLAPFGARTTLNLMRGLTVLAIPVSLAAGMAVAKYPRWTGAVIAACAVWAIGTAVLVVPGSCSVRPIRLDEIDSLRVDRCTFRWRAPSQVHRALSPLDSRAP
jgi:hypothetical protein